MTTATNNQNPSATASSTALPDVMPGHWTTAEGRDMAMRTLADPHMAHNRAHIPDFQLANAVFLDPGIANLTDAKERIRWLSVQLATALTPAKPVEPAAPAIPAGMVAWHGGDSAPDDWDGGPVLLRDGTMWDQKSPSWEHIALTADRDIIAYTRKPAAPAVSGDDALTPCPFCGDGDAIEQPFMADGLNALRPLGTRYMHCEKCGADGPGHDSISDARAAWNARAILADPACRLAPAGDGEKVHHECPACAWEARDIGAVLHNLIGQLERGTSILDGRAMRKLAEAKEAMARWRPIVDVHFAATSDQPASIA